MPERGFNVRSHLKERKMLRRTIFVELANETYAKESGLAYELAEAAAAERNQYPVIYPEPFNTIGCGYGPLRKHAENVCMRLANELNVDWESGSDADIYVTLCNGNKASLEQFYSLLGDRLESIRDWVINYEQLWPMKCSQVARECTPRG